MARAERRANVVWEGNLVHGYGKIVNVGSGALGELPITWASRTERSDGKTSPEELLAAAHAERLTVSATCAFEQVGEGFKVTTMDLDVRGKVPGLDQAGFEKVAQQAEQGCPISNALRNNVQIRVIAHLES
ncbi:MAG: osmotically inducible protein OsmC [Gemmatimonadetes bacterium]|nr:MAG: osmotically inducible protein OsmC [Gemmatimonadota bacterium]